MATKNIEFVVDGYYCFSLYRNIKSTYGKVIMFDGLVTSVCKALEEIVKEKCTVPATLRHYYMGTDANRIDSDLDEYKNALRVSRFGAKGRPLINGKEKAIDTMLYSDVMREANNGDLDYLVLLAGDGDHITLVQDLKKIGIETVLLYGEIFTNRKKTTGCSKELMDECFNSVNLFDLLDNNEIFQGSFKQTKSLTELMKGNASKTASKNVINEDFERKTLLVDFTENNSPSLVEKVVSAVHQVISDKENVEGRKLVFALQSQVGLKLKKNGIALPVSLGDYFDSYPSIFKTGTHPVTKALTVSVMKV